MCNMETSGFDYYYYYYYYYCYYYYYYYYDYDYDYDYDYYYYYYYAHNAPRGGRNHKSEQVKSVRGEVDRGQVESSKARLG